MLVCKWISLNVRSSLSRYPSWCECVWEREREREKEREATFWCSFLFRSFEIKICFSKQETAMIRKMSLFVIPQKAEQRNTKWKWTQILKATWTTDLKLDSFFVGLWVKIWCFGAWRHLLDQRVLNKTMSVSKATQRIQKLVRQVLNANSQKAQ